MNERRALLHLRRKFNKWRQPRLVAAREIWAEELILDGRTTTTFRIFHRQQTKKVELDVVTAIELVNEILEQKRAAESFRRSLKFHSESELRAKLQSLILSPSDVRFRMGASGELHCCIGYIEAVEVLAQEILRREACSKP